MLNIIYIQSPDQRHEILKNFDPEKQTWVVSDLKLKLEIQKIILTKKNCFEDQSVLRASELWQILSLRKFPFLKICNHDWIQSWVKGQIANNPDIKVGKNSFKTVVEALDLFYPILLHPDGSDRLRVWLTENPIYLARWGGWFLLAEIYFQKLIQSRRISKRWVQGLLQEQTIFQNDLKDIDEKNSKYHFFDESGANQNFKKIWNKKLIFDLGLQVNAIEIEIMRQLSREFEVCILIPQPEFKKDFSFLFKPYDDLVAHADKIEELKRNENSWGSETLVRKIKHHGVLSEIKYAVAAVRSWLEQGFHPEEILIAAPDIESYWPLLSPLLKAEGIPTRKNQVIRIMTVPTVEKWMSLLKIKMGQIDYESLESAVYARLDNPPRFEKFEALFRELLGAEDLRRLPEIQIAFDSDFSSLEILSREEFVSFLLKNFIESNGSNPFEILEWVLKELYSFHSLQQDSLRLVDWVYWLEVFLAKKEKLIHFGVENGIQITNISAADSLQHKKRIYLGLSENQIKKLTRQKLLSGEEVQKIASELGYYFEDPDTVPVEFDLKWHVLKSDQEFIMSYAETDFASQSDAASSFWLSLNTEILPNDNPPTVWDSKIASVRLSPHFSQGELGGVNFSVNDCFQPSVEGQSADKDFYVLKTKEKKKETLKKLLEKSPQISISASMIESYRKCPYILMAQKFFRLEDHPAIDLEVDRRSAGNFVHELLEGILKHPDGIRISQSDLENLIHELRKNSDLQFVEESIWSSLAKRYLRLALRFIEAENEYRKRFPEMKQVYLETSFSANWNFVEKKFDKNPEGEILNSTPDGGFANFEGMQHSVTPIPQFQIRGRMDRVDEDLSGHLALYDYKMTKGSYKNWSSWIKENRLQLLIYTIAIEDQQIEVLQNKEVVSALYYIIKDMSRDIGFKCEEVSQGLYELDAKKNKISILELEKIKNEIRDILQTIFVNIQDLNFEAQPLDKKTCNQCFWRTQCRAPHLI